MNRQIKELFDADMFVDTLEYFFTEVDKKEMLKMAICLNGRFIRWRSFGFLHN